MTTATKKTTACWKCGQVYRVPTPAPGTKESHRCQKCGKDFVVFGETPEDKLPEYPETDWQELGLPVDPPPTPYKPPAAIVRAKEELSKEERARSPFPATSFIVAASDVIAKTILFGVPGIPAFILLVMGFFLGHTAGGVISAAVAYAVTMVLMFFPALWFKLLSEGLDVFLRIERNTR